MKKLASLLTINGLVPTYVAMYQRRYVKIALYWFRNFSCQINTNIGEIIIKHVADTSISRSIVFCSRVARISQRGGGGWGRFWKFNTTVNELNPNFHYS